MQSTAAPAGMAAAVLHADPPPFDSRAVEVPGGHRLQVRQSGQPDGIAAVVLHGGPGSATSPLLRRVLDPRRYRIVSFDQRGCGSSQPRGGTAHNTTADLLADLRLLRERLRIDRWLVVGGSWGAALALAHALDAPDAVAALLLRSAFLSRAQDIDDFFQNPHGHAPAAWQRLCAPVPADARGDLLGWYARGLAEGGPAEQRRLALAWWQWEAALSFAATASKPDTAAAAADATPPAEADDATVQRLIDRYRVQAHYLVHRCWLDAPPLLERCAALPAVPCLLLHADDDCVCPPGGAQALQARVPGSRLHWVPGAGHDAAHPAMIDAMVRALDAYATHRRFEPVEPS